MVHAPPEKNVPAAQLTHVAEETMPIPVLNVPAGQLVHVAVPSEVQPP